MSGIMTFWKTVMWLIRKNCWNTTPTVSFLNFCSSSFPSADVTTPATLTSPGSGKSSAAAMLSRVVLPLPEGPTTATIPPLSTLKDTASRAFTDSAFDEYALVTESKTIAASVAGVVTACDPPPAR